MHNTTQTILAAQQSSAPPSLPEEPLTRIEPSGTWTAINFRELWTYKELLYFLTWRDLKVRYKQTALGVVWVVMQPLMTTVIFTVFLGRLAGVPSDGVPYPVFAYAGLWAWTFFANSVGSSSNSLVGNAHLITKVYFPRLLVPCAAIIGRFIDFIIASALLVGLMISFNIVATWNLLMLPVLVALLTLLALGAGLLLSAMNVRFRDVGAVLPLLTQLWMFASPVLYPLNLVPERWRWLYVMNPTVGILENLRASLFGTQFNWSALAASTAITFVLLIFSSYAFRRMERDFADVI